MIAFRRCIEQHISRRNILVIVGVVVVGFMFTLAAIDFLRGRAHVVVRRGTPAIWVERGSPMFWREIAMEVAIGVGLGGGLIALSAWMNRLEGQKDASKDSKRA
jgi:hypothetical protein